MAFPECGIPGAVAPTAGRRLLSAKPASVADNSIEAARRLVGADETVGTHAVNDPELGW